MRRYFIHPLPLILFFLWIPAFAYGQSELFGGYSRSNPVVTRERDRIYRGYFKLPGWEGHLIAYELRENGVTGSPLWDAGEVMNRSGRGTIYTWSDAFSGMTRGSLFEGSKAKELVFYNSLNPPPEEDINHDGYKNFEDAETIVHFVLDPGFDHGKYKGSRSGKWRLGDIYHSTPVVVGKPPFNFSDDPFPKKYSEFQEAHQERPTMVYVGANDGMLHAFDSRDGKERFAIIPKNLLGRLRELRKGHSFYVDSSPRAYDVYFKKGREEWRTVLISGEGRGGNYYFAVDVTDPNDPTILWEWTDLAVGETWSRPEIGRVKMGGDEKFVVFVGGGYSTQDHVGNAFYVIDIETGKTIKRFDVGDQSNKIPAGATALDSDSDGRIDGIYFGDIQGNLWKIKIEKDKEGNIEQWKLIKWFEPQIKNPIFYPPAVTKNNQGKILVYFGQGDELNLSQKGKPNSFFEIWDVEDKGVLNWEVELRDGEKVLAPPTLANNVIYFTTWEYTGKEADKGIGVGRLYGLTSTKKGVTGGTGALFFDLEGNPFKTPQKSFELSEGIPSAPVVTNGVLYVSDSFDPNRIIKISIPSWSKRKLKSWREVF